VIIALKLREVYEWYSEQVDKPVGEFDRRDRNMAVAWYLEYLDDVVRSNRVSRHGREELVEE
jgi:hypothetical protein